MTATRRRLVIVAIAVVLVLAAAAGVAWWAWSARTDAEPDDDTGGTTAPTTTPSEESVDEAVDEAFSSYLDECTAPATSVPERCGIVVPWAADLASLEELDFEVEKAPALTTDLDAGRFVASDGVLTATATGTTDDGATGSFSYRTESWTLRGTIRNDDGRVVLAVR
ncbi:MAG: hypothetical protein ACTHZX_11405 [Microbacterium sp.]